MLTSTEMDLYLMGVRDASTLGKSEVRDCLLHFWAVAVIVGNSPGFDSSLGECKMINMYRDGLISGSKVA